MNAVSDDIASNGLTSQTRRALRARAHALKPVVWIAQDGASGAVLKEIDRAPGAHELVKIHAAVDGRDQREQLLAGICTELAAQPVQVIGKMLIAYRPRPPEPATTPTKPRPRPRRAVTAPKARPSGAAKRSSAKRAMRRAPRRTSR